MGMQLSSISEYTSICDTPANELTTILNAASALVEVSYAATPSDSIASRKYSLKDVTNALTSNMQRLYDDLTSQINQASTILDTLIKGSYVTLTDYLYYVTNTAPGKYVKISEPDTITGLKTFKAALTIETDVNLKGKFTLDPGGKTILLDTTVYLFTCSNNANIGGNLTANNAIINDKLTSDKVTTHKLTCDTNIAELSARAALWT